MAEYIEREAYVAELAKGTIITDDLYGMGIMSGIDYAMKKLNEQPAADVAPVRHGKWKRSGAILECQLCGEIYSQLGGNAGKSWNYCPNCGAKMDLEE